MNKFKEKWQISRNWQLLYPLVGICSLIYLAARINTFFGFENLIVSSLSIAVIANFLLFVTLKLFNLLENKWRVNARWEMIRIFIVFAITGSGSVFVGRPLIKLVGISPENIPLIPYWILFGVTSLIVYQVLLVSIGWLLGQFNFFWEFEKKMLKRFGLGSFLKD